MERREEVAEGQTRLTRATFPEMSDTKDSVQLHRSQTQCADCGLVVLRSNLARHLRLRHPPSASEEETQPPSAAEAEMHPPSASVSEAELSPSQSSVETSPVTGKQIASIVPVSSNVTSVDTRAPKGGEKRSLPDDPSPMEGDVFSPKVPKLVVKLSAFQKAIDRQKAKHIDHNID